MFQSDKSIIVLLLLLLLSINIVLLDIVIFSKLPLADAASTQLPVATKDDYSKQCPKSCTDLIQNISTARITSIPLPARFDQGNFQVLPKEFYVPIGSGTTRSLEYEELAGAEAYIDSSNYSRIKEVTFEVFLRNPTGNGQVYAKLFNVTDKHDVWFSEVNFEGGGIARKTAVINLENGNKLYRVMLRSTLKYDAYVDNARVKIVSY